MGMTNRRRVGIETGGRKRLSGLERMMLVENRNLINMVLVKDLKDVMRENVRLCRLEQGVR